MPNPPHRIGIIGGSGLYNIEGFENQKWRTVKTPFGAASDQLLTGTPAPLLWKVDVEGFEPQVL